MYRLLHRLSVTAVCLISIPALLFPIDFNSPRAYSFGLGFQGYSMATGDFNGDGIPDLAVTTYSYSVPCCLLQIFLGGAGGGMSHAANYELRYFSFTYQGLVAADFNGDGKLDLALSGGTQGIAILLGNGDGTFAAPLPSPAGPGALALAVCDCNGDGKPDIVMALTSANSVSILLGNGDGTLQPAVSYPVGTSPQYLAVADLNRDGKPDLAVTNYGSANVSILFGAGNGTFYPALNYPAGNQPTYITTGDFNKDGRPDLAISLRNGSVALLLASGGGKFLPPVTVDGGPQPAALLAADIDHDGNLDLAVANQLNYVTGGDGYTISIVKGNGDGSFQPPQPYDVPGDPTALAVADYNLDGSPDLAVAGLNALSILFNNRHGGLQDMVNDPAGLAPSSIAAADFNGDAKPDLVVANHGSNNISILLGNGDGTFRPQVTYDALTAPISVVTGDFNGDGKSDVAVASTSALAVMFGNGDGTFSPPVTTSLSVYGQLVAADFDGDGKTDLAAIDSCQCSAVTLLSNADGTFRQVPLGGGQGAFQSLAVGDFDGDGVPDLAVQTAIFGYYFTAEYVAIWHNQGHGYFYFVTDTYGDGPVVVADFNGDGLPDLAGGARGIWVEMGTGPNSFGAIADYPAQYPLAMAAGDFNGDGKVDLALLGYGVGGASSDTVSVLLNYGLGKFQAQREYVAGGCAVALAVADFNGDGKSDIATANSCSNDVSILKNTTE